MRFRDKRPERSLGEFILLKLTRERGLRWAATYLRRWLKPAVVELKGLRFEAVPGDNLTEGRIWGTTTCPEARTISAVCDAARDRKVLFLDIGANCGLYTCMVSAEMAPGSKTLAFEPNPTMVQRLKRNLELNEMQDQVEVVEVALGGEDGIATLHVDGYNLGETSLLSSNGQGGREVQVPVRQISQYLECAEDYDATIIKVDVEGLEDLVLGPLLDGEDGSPLPDLIILEVDHRSDWKRDVVDEFLAGGYRQVLDTEGNVGLALAQVNASNA